MALSEVELKTLILLANRGPLTGYDLHSKMKEDGSGGKADTNIMSDPYWLKVRKKLLDANLIVECYEEGRRKPYRVSEDGFDFLVRNHLDDIQCFDVFAKYCSDYFPLVFGLWSEIKNHDLDDYVKSSLKQVVRDTYLDVFREFVLGLRGRFLHVEFVEALSVRLYLPELFYEEDEASEVIPFEDIRKFRSEEPKIYAFIMEWIGKQEERLNKRIKKLEHVKKGL